MPIISAIDKEKQIVHVKTNEQTTDEEFGKSMSELMSIISEFHNPKMLIEYTGHTDEEEKQTMNRLRTFNLETIKCLKQLAICSHYELNIFHETLEYCRNKDIPYQNFNDIEHAKEWLGAK